MTIEKIIKHQEEEPTCYLIVADAVLDDKLNVTRNVTCDISSFNMVSTRTLGNSLLKEFNNSKFIKNSGKRIIQVNGTLFINAQLYVQKGQNVLVLSQKDGFLKLNAGYENIHLRRHHI